MEVIFDASPDTIAEVLMDARNNEASTFLGHAQSLRLERDPGLASVYIEVSDILPRGTLFQNGADITYLVARAELDKTNRSFSIGHTDVDPKLLTIFRERESGTRTALREAENVIAASKATLANIDELGPGFKSLLVTYESTIRDQGVDVYQKLLFQIGSVLMLDPIMQKLKRLRQGPRLRFS